MAIEKGVLQPAPPGLLSLLQLKQRGKNPDTLSDTVVPVVDLTEWYAVLDREFLQWELVMDGGAGGAEFAFNFVAGADAASSIIIPNDEVWFVWNVSASFGASIGGELHGLLATATRPDGVGWSPTYHHITAPIDLVAASAFTVPQAMAGGDIRRWFKGGTIFGVGITYVTIPANEEATVSGTVEFTRMKV